jgi:DNA helicase-2/ATP-dependent DNA helicase PcrA
MTSVPGAYTFTGDAIIITSMFVPRPSQLEVLAYRSGKMGVSAVPGSGKTATLSQLAAEIILRQPLQEDQEILIVTLTNSAVENFRHRIAQALLERPGMGLIPRYRVRTLHGLAHDLIRERPYLGQLSPDFQILDDGEARRIRSQIVQAWLHGNPQMRDEWLNPELADNQLNKIHKRDFPELLETICESFIRTAKAKRVTTEYLLSRLGPVPLPLAEMGCAFYGDYQRALTALGALDFDDLIRLALEALEQDHEYLERLRQRWPYILEDEAQDSNPLQEQILQLLCGQYGNWVRVGDPNQAIYETFTTASPKFLRKFLDEKDVNARDLPHSGRSTASIISLANHLIDWVQAQEILVDVRDALSPPHILPVPPGDEQSNPQDNPQSVIFSTKGYTPEQEAQAIAASLKRWLPDHLDETCAVLASTNKHAARLQEALKHQDIPVVDRLMGTPAAVRTVAAELAAVIDYLCTPQSPAKLAEVYRVWQENLPAVEEERQTLCEPANLLRRLIGVEDFLWPRGGRDWLEKTNLAAEDPATYTSLTAFRSQVQRWQAAVGLPIDQLMLAVSQDLYTKPLNIALAYELAVQMRHALNLHPDWQLDFFIAELSAIAENVRRFSSLGEMDSGFNPDDYKGQVVIATIHKAKGLEWDRVYLTSINTYDFPFGQTDDQYVAEKYFVRGQTNLQAEALAQLDILLTNRDVYTWYEPGRATQTARMDFVRERLRLLYVGMTRAKKELIITWNSGKKGNLQAALPLRMLIENWKPPLSAPAVVIPHSAENDGV